MRTEVKVAAVASLVIVVVAGWYYLGRGNSEQPVQLAQAAPPPAKPAVPATNKPAVNRPAVPAKQPTRTPPATPAKPAPAEPVAAPSAPPGVFDIGQPAADKPPTTLAELLRSDAEKKDASSPADSDKASPSLSGTRGTTGRAGATTSQPATDTRTAMNPGQPAPSATASNAGKPVLDAPGVRKHTVERGDTLSVLAEIYYGSQKHVNVLLAANPQIKDPGALLIGTVLAIPPLPASSPQTAAAKPAASASPPTTPAAGTYLVKEGDSFYGIAREVLGSSSRWRELYELNKATVGEDPGNLRVGHVLKLPEQKTVATGN